MPTIRDIARALIEGDCPHPPRQRVVLTAEQICMACGLVFP